MEQLEAEEASKWEQGSRKENAKKLEEKQKRQEKARAKKERDALLTAEEEQLGKGGKGKRKMK
ncbi:BEM_collapsed_G0022630.mRNA.1.CDS.1 [Saccharomyces cerevisiae]|nr:BEM_collapsed_G0022630.mRNA.1.CDS.1 [Saccharomyces cerevisiae]